jgi:hypothetical protein
MNIIPISAPDTSKNNSFVGMAETSAVAAARRSQGLFVNPTELPEDDRKEYWKGKGLVHGPDWLEREPEAVDPVLEKMFDRGDKFVVIGASKTRKSFMIMQLSLCLSAGIDFLGIKVTKARRVLLVQMEIQDRHAHRRFKKLFNALGLKPEHADRIRIINGRGRNITPDDILAAAKEVDAEVVIIDPLYKLMDGAENGVEDMKPILTQFDVIAEETGAAVGYVHHDGKGNPGSRDTRDRGAGSGVLGRDYDACMTITPHEEGDDHVVIDMLLRNYPIRQPFTAVWEDGRFKTSDILPVAAKSKNPNANPTSKRPDSEYFDLVRRALGAKPLNAGELDQALRDKGLAKEKATSVRNSALNHQVIEMDTDFGKGKVYRVKSERRAL